MVAISYLRPISGLKSSEMIERNFRSTIRYDLEIYLDQVCQQPRPITNAPRTRREIACIGEHVSHQSAVSSRDEGTKSGWLIYILFPQHYSIR